MIDLPPGQDVPTPIVADGELIDAGIQYGCITRGIQRNPDGLAQANINDPAARKGHDVSDTMPLGSEEGRAWNEWFKSCSSLGEPDTSKKKNTYKKQTQIR